MKIRTRMNHKYTTKGWRLDEETVEIEFDTAEGLTPTQISIIMYEHKNRNFQQGTAIAESRNRAMMVEEE
jgi:hypothetical protein